MRRKHLLTYGVLGVGAYLLYKHMQAATPAVAIAPPAAAPAPGVAGFGRLGYFPSGADRPFARMNMPGAGMPFARYSHGVKWY